MSDLGGSRLAGGSGSKRGGDGGLWEGSEDFSFASSCTRWHALSRAADLGEVLGIYSPYVLVVESRVYDLHASLFSSLEGKGIWVIKVLSGEEKKCFSVIEGVISSWVRHRIHRGYHMVIMGGGSHLDAMGFAASIYLRGVSMVYFPTTFLAMVDACFGGKNGINMELSGRMYKNMVGVIVHARAIYCHDVFVDTWAHRHWREGFAEVIKYAFLSSSSLLEELFREDLASYKKDIRLRWGLVRSCLGIKYSYVMGDEREGGARRVLLNFGHTLGHSIEGILGVSHGEAVSCGMVFSAWVSVREGLLSMEVARRLCGVLRRYGLPLFFRLDVEAIVEGLWMDKKRRDLSVLRLICLRDIGDACVLERSMEQIIMYLRAYDKDGVSGSGIFSCA